MAALALAPPLLSLDVFSYVAYGRLSVEGLNPYEHAPQDLPGDAAADRVEDFGGAVSVYGPLFTFLSHGLALLGVPGAVWALKGIAALSVLGLSWLAARLASRRGGSPQRAAALVGLNPLVLVHGVGGAHNDALMALGVLATVALATGGRAASAGATLVGAVAVKSAAAVIAPFAFLGSRAAPGERERGGQLRRLLGGAAAAAAAIVAMALLAYGPAAGEALDILGSSQSRTSHNSIPATLARALDADLDLLRALLAGAYVAGVAGAALWTWRGGDWVRAAAWAALGLLVASAYMTPWYVLWALPLVAIARDRVLVVLTLALCAQQLPNAIPD